ncbi:MAG: hypothetical protein II436_02615 [Oscillospiraceae bacterium]|nr:hypothetical protein [Oscillospiraceae bacterium]MBQ2596273.1 hypothetical protein [Oscillospiraceae bacterium]
MDIYTKTIRLRNADVDMHRRLRTSTLLTMLQEAAIAHTEQLGMGREKTLDRGLLWIITLQRLQVYRMPVYDEVFTLECWPGKTMHVLFPRYYRMLAEDGSLLAEGSALWALIDQENHELQFPDTWGISIPGTVTGRECPLPRAPRPLALTENVEFQVPYSYIDLNQHMNNVHYLDLAEDVLPAAVHDFPLKSLEIEYSGEARLGQTIRLGWGRLGNSFFLTGEGERRMFRLRLEYESAAPETERL